MSTVQWIIDTMEAWAPTSWAEDFDNVGLLIGDRRQPVKKILVALDATDDVIQEAILGNYNCIVTHHPLTYNPLKRVVADDSIGRKILTLAKHGISLYSAHTNLDKAPGGVNDCLAKKLGIINTSPLAKDPFNNEIGIGRIAELPSETTLGELAEQVKKSLNLQSVRYCGNLSAKIRKVAMCGGSGMSIWQAARDANCHVYITGDVKYSDALAVLDAGMCILDITHYVGENIIVEAIVERLRTKANEDNISLVINATAIDGQAFHMM
ncbi:MAG: Nif3-like dinuclear metal center hexameric protein [Firmicutes bacterium]|nr:Nif3-like dinuclear metal center hexameric protein [Bacillota bacterium]